MNPIIELRDVWKIYQMGEVEVPALKGLTLQIREKEFVAVTGPSGCGKSTSLNMIGCLDIPTRGTVFLDNIDISTLPESDLAQIRGKKIGFIFQTFNLITSLTALENVVLPTLFIGSLTADHQKQNKAKEILEKVGLGERLDHKPTELSGGERQRVAIARALINNPDIILADEPTGNLDSQTGKEVLSIIRGLHKEGKTIILITHDTSIAKYAQRKIELKDGKVLRTK